MIPGASAGPNEIFQCAFIYFNKRWLIFLERGRFDLDYQTKIISCISKSIGLNLVLSLISGGPVLCSLNGSKYYDAS